MRTQTPIENMISYTVHKYGLTAATYFNGVATASTVTTDAVSTTVNEGAGIPIARFKWARITVINGDVGTGLVGTVTAYVGQRGKKSNDASVTLVPDFSISWTDADDLKTKTGYINLESIPALGAYERVLWIKSVVTALTSIVTVDLTDSSTGFAGATLEAGAVYPASII